MNKSGNVSQKVLSLFLALVLLVALWGVVGTEAQAASANKYGTYTGAKPSKYTFTGSTVHILPKKVFCDKSSGKLYYYAYVYNNTDKTIYGLKNLRISVRTSGGTLIARQTFFKNTKKSITINPGSYKTYCFIFDKKNIKKKKFYYGTAKKLKTQAEFTYYT